MPMISSPTPFLTRLSVVVLGVLLILASGGEALAKRGAGPFLLETQHKFPAKSTGVTAPKGGAPAAVTTSGRVESGDRFRRKLSSRSAIIMDATTGAVLYAHDPDRPAQPASTLKVLTGLIAIESLRDSDTVTASQRAASMPRSKINIQPGKAYVADDMINAVLLASANDASVAIAEKVAGSEQSFARLMTSKARSLGATNTVCKTASGLTAPGQMSTARDLAVVFDKAMRDREFAERMRKTKVKTRFGQVLRNHNKALWQVEGAVGGKTGYTNAARQTYVGKFSRGNDAIVVALMGSETMWHDISRLVEYGFARKAQLAAIGSGSDPSGKIALNSVARPFQNKSLQVLSENKKQRPL
ncbi:MAG: D-alanyl-D-alanine carboxypeptidase family protein [Thermodesulfobacteriota bacterium]